METELGLISADLIQQITHHLKWTFYTSFELSQKDMNSIM